MEERQADDRVVTWSEVKEMCDRLAVQLGGKVLRRGELPDVEVTMLRLTEHLEQLVIRYTAEAGGTHAVLRARQAVDTMRQVLRWLARYGAFAPEVEIQKRLRNAQHEAMTALALLERVDGSHPL